MTKNDDRLKISIRQTDEKDVPLILEFIRLIAEFEHLSDNVMASEDSIRVAFFGPRPYAEAAVAEAGDKPAGFVTFFHNFSSFMGKPSLYVEDIYVHPEYRGMGVVKALMSYCARIAKERDCGRMDWSVLDWNPARKFYESLGAKADGKWITYRLGKKGIFELAGD
ncbi:GNAT family N-acetyltransferase [Methanolobus sp. ZRKC2]|uniref:GNAT family N-acetyltransferase n=1 Tax=Methanolobus sp. ZRKC2 TaxID=3125783 RepID=UPI003243FD1E